MFLDCDMPIQLALSSEYDDYDRTDYDRTIMIDWKIVSSCTNYLTDYKICNILYLNK